MFTADWFTKFAPAWEEWLKEYKGKADLQFLEVGCFEGRATLWLLENILTGVNPSMSVIDDFIGGSEYTGEQSKDVEKNFRENLKGWEPILNVYKGKSGDVLRTADFQEGGKFDFIYIDASHYAPEVLEDTILCWGILKKGGILVWDDYKWQRHDNPLMTPKLAIDSFYKIYSNQIELISKGYQVAVRKI